MLRRPGQFVALQVNISLNDVGFPTANLPHQSQFLLVDGNVSVGPLFLVDLLDVVSHVALPVVGVVADGAVIWLQPAVHEQVIEQLDTPVEHFGTVQALQSELLVEFQVSLVLVVGGKAPPATLAKMSFDFGMD